MMRYEKTGNGCRRAGMFVLAAPLMLLAAPTRAAVTVSSDATENMSCSGGVCVPTAKSAVLNAGDLETLLASGNVTVTTTGSGVQASDIAVKAALSWSTPSALTLEAHRSLAIDRHIAVAGTGGLALVTNSGGRECRRRCKKNDGTFSIGHNGRVTFASLSGSLSIEGVSYTLVNTIATLASAVAANPSGAFALAADFDASQDGTYTSVPVPTPLTGTFEGLGNTISNLTIDDTNDTWVALFAQADYGTLRDISVLHANVYASASESCAAPLVGLSYGNIIDASASGSATSENSCAGGLIGYFEGEGTIILSDAATTVSGVFAGGLVGVINAYGSVDQSFATGKVSSAEFAGGLVGDDRGGPITNCYSTGAATVPKSNQDFVGGFAAAIESDQYMVTNSYSTGRVTGGGRTGSDGNQLTRGGFVGYVLPDLISDDYWDTDTSGFTNLARGAGTIKNDPGVEGLTTQAFQSGLPYGFDPTVWGENADINGGLPYLLANPPR